MSWLPTLSGQTFDLVHPDPAAVDFEDVALVLSRLPRFLGRTRGGPYSVAQHCVLGADAVLAEAGDTELAAAFLLHDAHEAFIGDIPTPVAEALAWHDPDHNGMALPRLKRSLDAAIYAAAGLPGAWRAHEAAIRDMDLRLCRAERDALMVPSKRGWHPAIESARPIPSLPAMVPWDGMEAEGAYREALERLLPRTLRKAA